ncbi:MAG: hypothetical protein RhofKO_25130 [Rhodothermales bacterium]
MVYYTVYSSSARRALSDAELQDILAASRRNNEPVGVTGLLLYVEGNFLQILEGAQEDVESTYERIMRDERHSQILRLVSGHHPTRQFPDWSMGFRRVNRTELDAQLPGFSDALERNQWSAFESEAVSRKVATMMRAFRIVTRV